MEFNENELKTTEEPLAPQEVEHHGPMARVTLGLLIIFFVMVLMTYIYYGINNTPYQAQMDGSESEVEETSEPKVLTEEEKKQILYNLQAAAKTEELTPSESFENKLQMLQELRAAHAAAEEGASEQTETTETSAVSGAETNTAVNSLSASKKTENYE